MSWLGWSLYVGYLPHYGPRYMDVRFKGERIAYEISMQEALACEWTFLDRGAGTTARGATAGRQAGLVEFLRGGRQAGRQALAEEVVVPQTVWPGVWMGQVCG